MTNEAWRREYEAAAYAARELLDNLIRYGRSKRDTRGHLDHEPTRDELEALTKTLEAIQWRLRAAVAQHAKGQLKCPPMSRPVDR